MIENVHKYRDEFCGNRVPKFNRDPRVSAYGVHLMRRKYINKDQEGRNDLSGHRKLKGKYRSVRKPHKTEPDNIENLSSRSINREYGATPKNHNPYKAPHSQMGFQDRRKSKDGGFATAVTNTRYKSNKNNLTVANRNSIESLISNENPKGSLFAVNGLFAKLAGMRESDDHIQNGSKKM